MDQDTTTSESTRTDGRASTLEQAKRLKIARVEKGWTQRQLAQASGVDQGDISKIESGKQSATMATMDKLFAAIGGSVALDAVDGVLRIHGTKPGKFVRVDPLDEAPPIVWMVEGFAARGAVTMVAGAPGAGKSLLTQSIAVTMASAEEPTERAGFVVHPGKVVMIDAENGKHLIQRRARAMGLTPEAAERYATFTLEGVDLEADYAEVRQLLIDEAADMLVVDSWLSTWSGSESSGDAVARCLDKLRGLAQELDLAIVLIHHTTKSGDSYGGSRRIAATIEAVFVFTRDEDGLAHDRLLMTEKMRLDAEPDTKRLVLTATGVHSAHAVNPDGELIGE